MDRLETDKLTLLVVEGKYLHLTIHSDEEITLEDVPAVVEFLDQFTEPVPILIERRGRYSISAAVQIAMYKGTKRRLKAVAYLERDYLDSLLTRIARVSYFQHTKVKSFYDREDAVEWLKSAFNSAPIEPGPHDRNTE